MYMNINNKLVFSLMNMHFMLICIFSFTYGMKSTLFTHAIQTIIVLRQLDSSISVSESLSRCGNHRVYAHWNIWWCGHIPTALRKGGRHLGFSLVNQTVFFLITHARRKREGKNTYFSFPSPLPLSACACAIRKNTVWFTRLLGIVGVA